MTRFSERLCYFLPHKSKSNICILSLIPDFKRKEIISSIQLNNIYEIDIEDIDINFSCRNDCHVKTGFYIEDCKKRFIWIEKNE